MTTFVQANGGEATTASGTFTLPSPVLVGDLLVAQAGQYGSSTITERVSDTSAGVWTRVSPGVFGTGTFAMWYKVATVAASNGVTVTFSTSDNSNQFITCQASVYRGAGAYFNSKTATSGTVTNPTTGTTAAAVAAGGLVVTATFANGSPTSVAPAASAGVTPVQRNKYLAGTSVDSTINDILSSAAGVQQGAFTVNPADKTYVGCIVFSPPSTASSSPTPDTIAGLDSWYKADSLSQASGSGVSSWPDSSGNGHTATQTTAAKQPVLLLGQLNGQSVLNFTSSSSSSLLSSASASSPAQTVFAVVRPTGGAAYQTIRGSNGSGGLQVRVNSSGVLALVKENVAGIGNGNTALPSTAYSVACATYADASSYALYVNGTLDVSGSHAVTLTSGITTDIGENYGTSGSEYLTGYIAELIVYNRVLTSTERAQVHTYLQNKYAITVSDYIASTSVSVAATSPSSLRFIAPAGGVGFTTNVTLVGIPARITVAAPAGTLTTTQAVALVGAVAPVSLVSPAGTVTLAAGTPASYLRGVNTAGGDFAAAPATLPGTYGNDYSYDTATAFTNIGARGNKLIRLPFLWERIQPTRGLALDPTELSRLQGVVANISAAGMKAVLDVHNYARYINSTANGGNTLTLGNDLPTSSFVDLWTRLSTAFKGNAGIYAYGLMNEPHDILASSGVYTLNTMRYTFDTSTQGWADEDGATPATLTVDTATTHDGTGSLKIVKSPTTATSYWQMRIGSPGPLGSYAGGGDTFSFWIYCPAGQTGWQALVGMQSGGASTPAYSDLKGGGPLTPGAWTQVTYKVPVAALNDVNKLLIQVFNNAPGTTAPVTFYLDSVSTGSVTGAATGAQVWENISQQAVTAIRNNTDTTRIMVPGYAYASAKNFATNHPTPWITDSASNTTYEGHYYFDGDNSGTYVNTYATENTAATSAGFASLAARATADMQSFANWCTNHSVRGFIGECGWPNTGDTTNWNVVGTAVYQVADTAKLDFTYWSAGARWGSTYLLSAYTGTNQDVPQTQASIIEAHQSSVQTVPTVSLAGGVSGISLSATAGVVTAQTNVVVSGVSTNNILSAPAGTVSVTASVALLSAPTSFTYIASAGTVNVIRNVTMPGAVSSLTASAPPGIISTVTNVSLSGVVQGVAFAAPAGVVGTTSSSTNAAPIGVSASLSFLALSGVITNSTNTALTGSFSKLFLVAPAGGVIPAVQINGAPASVTLSSPAGTVAMAVNATPLGTPAVVSLAAPAGGVNVTSPVNLSGATAALALLSVVGGVVGTSVAAGVVSALSLTSPVGLVSGTAALTGQTVMLSLNAPAGSVTASSPAVSVSLTGAPTLFALAAPAGASSLNATLAGALSTLSTSAPAGIITASSAATNTNPTAAPSPLTVSSTPGLVNPVSVVVNAALSGPSASLALGTPAGSFVQTVVIPGSTATLALTSPAGVAAMNVTPAGVTTGFSYSALAGVLLLRTNVTPLGANTFVTVAAPPGLVTISVATTNINLSGVTTALTLAAPAGAVLPSVVVNGTSSAVALSAPAGVVSLSVVIPGPTVVLLHTAPAGVVTPVSAATNVMLSGPSASLVLSVPAGVTSAATNVLLAGNVASLSTFTPVGAPVLVTNAAPLGAPVAMTLFAPSGTVSNAVVMYGAPASLAFTGSPGTAAMSVNAFGATTSLFYQAIPGSLLEHSYIVTGTTALMKTYSLPGGVAIFIGVPHQMKGAVRTAGRWTPRVPPARTRST